MMLPRDFLEELECELETARDALSHDRILVAALEELCTLTRALTLELVLPVTVFDVIDAADEPVERQRRAELVRLVRSRVGFGEGTARS
jgi:hypothetical protein